jgi:hypothetical protein
MKTEYEVNAEFTKDVDAIVNEKRYVEFNPIREQELKITSILAIRTNNEGEHVEPKGNPIVCRKLAPVYQLLTGAAFVVVGDYYFWTHADDIKKKAAIHRAIMTINVERNKKGEISLKTRKPDIQEFRATVAHFGAWNEGLLDMREALKTSAKQFAESQKPKG